MTRQIKFRAWDKKDKLWIAGFSIPQSGTLSEIGDVELMQFTGLLDKNGKEVYEGDLVHFDEEELRNSPRPNSSPTKQIIWRETYPGFGLKSMEDAEDETAAWNLFYLTKYLEVIGNIYENPELLKT